MALLRLHDKNNPTEIKLVASDDISAVETWPDNGSIVLLKSAATVNVKESPDEIYNLANEEK